MSTPIRANLRALLAGTSVISIFANSLYPNICLTAHGANGGFLRAVNFRERVLRFARRLCPGLAAFAAFKRRKLCDASNPWLFIDMALRHMDRSPTTDGAKCGFSLQINVIQAMSGCAEPFFPGVIGERNVNGSAHT